MSWTRVNWSIAVWFVAAFAASTIPYKPVYFGILPHLNAFCGLVFLFVTGLWMIAGALRHQVAEYQPTDAAAAKRINEQVKLMATTINTVAIAVASAFAIAAYARDEAPNYPLMWIYAGIAAHFHTVARSLLGSLKDETLA